MDTRQLQVKLIVPEGKNAATFFLEPVDGLPIPFEAGQFLTFIFMRHGQEIRRSYSIASTPGLDAGLAITVKRIPNGEISRQMLDHIKMGDILQSLAPAGRFTVSVNPLLQRQFFFIVAGSGIVPVFSLIRKILQEETKSTIILIYQNHDEQDIIFNTSLQSIAANHPLRFTWVNLLSMPPHDNHTSRRLTNDQLEKMVTDYHIPETPAMFYLCGPPSFMRMSLFTLKVLGFSDVQIKKENFTVEYLPPAPLVSDRSPKQVTIHYREKSFRISAAYPMNILQAALNNAISLPYSCRGGRCSTCMARCVSGSVVMSINEVLTDEDLKAGWVLPCVGYATTDIELRY